MNRNEWRLEQASRKALQLEETAVLTHKYIKLVAERYGSDSPRTRRAIRANRCAHQNAVNAWFAWDILVRARCAS